MKLNKQGRDEIRQIIEKELKNLSQGERIHLPKNRLEELLFENIDYNKETHSTLKLPYWSGEFLAKIDLSEIDFTNVTWSLVGEDISQSSLSYLDEDSREKITSESFGMPKEVNYQNTNANIDFSSSWEFNTTRYSYIQNCNFSGMDFSKINIASFKKIENCNLSNTNIQVSEIDKIESASIIDTNLDNLNFWNCTLRAYELAAGKTPFIDCSFVNTGLSIKYEAVDFKEDKTVLNTFAQMIKNKKLDGCTINGKRLHSEAEKRKIAEEKLREYEKMKADLSYSLTTEIKKQIKSLGSKK